MQTYTNKSNAARAAKKKNGGTLDGLTLMGTEGAWYYGKLAQTTAGVVVAIVPVNEPAPAPGELPLPVVAAAGVVVNATKARRKAPANAYDPANGPTSGRITGYVIDRDREERFGVKRRSAGTIGGRLWAMFDAMQTEFGGAHLVPVATVKERAAAGGFNANKTTIEFYLWRKFMGVRGRGAKQKVAGA